MREKPCPVSPDASEHRMLRALVDEGIRSTAPYVAPPFVRFVAQFHGWQVTVQSRTGLCGVSRVVSVHAPDHGLWQRVHIGSQDGLCNGGLLCR
ncbi:hypothetical protein [Paraburkholderia sp. BL21I4N1]|uniref:hypothetical protein n=1 Tax=Paraburkholderia sp. BL21I4N1 TaxID=1938801 RepID=UPI000D3F4128|nr:hypothetical protein [Paraburkholderia sp. BL21I4N1]PQV44150.1 hypothetical protein B0G83_12748 [Paraburkholderia sp. BL21I4N1]